MTRRLPRIIPEHRRPATAAGLLLALAVAGCYTYVPARPGEVSPGTRVRVLLSEEEADRLSDVTWTRDRAVEGTLLEEENGELLLLVPVITQTRGIRVETLRQRIRLSPEDILLLERRELNRGKTVVVVGTGALIVGAVLANELWGGANPGSEPPEAPPQDAIIWIRIPVGR